MRANSVMLLGRDHAEFGRYSMEVVAKERTVCAISVGAEGFSPAHLAKAGSEVPNEDALLAIDSARHVLLAIADAHFGPESSHHLISEVRRCAEPIPTDSSELDELLGGIRPLNHRTDSESTLLLSVFDRSVGRGFGVSYGDSSLAVVGDTGARVVNVYNGAFVAADDPRTLDPDRAHRFQYFAGPRELVMAYSDGVNECHYRSPETSITTAILHELYLATKKDPEGFATEVISLALRGVDGFPGGQDNITLIVAEAGDRAREPAS